MATSLPQQCYAEGFQRTFVKLAEARMSKKATGATGAVAAAAHAAMSPTDAKFLQALGAKVFARATSHPSPGVNMLNSFLPGYGEMRAVHDLRAGHMDTMSGINRLLRRASVGSPEHSALMQRMQDAVRTNQGAEAAAFETMGRTVKPRLDFINRAVPGAAGLAVGGGIGTLYGSLRGGANQQGADSMKLHDAPIMDRLKYLLRPSRGPELLSNPRPQFRADDLDQEKYSHVKQSINFSTGIGNVLGGGLRMMGRGLSAGGSGLKTMLKSPAAMWGKLNAAGVASQGRGVSPWNVARNMVRGPANVARATGAAMKGTPGAYTPLPYSPVMQTMVPRAQAGGMIRQGLGSARNYLYGATALGGIGAIGAAAASPTVRMNAGEQWGQVIAPRAGQFVSNIGPNAARGVSNAAQGVRGMAGGIGNRISETWGGMKDIATNGIEGPADAAFKRLSNWYNKPDAGVRH